MKWYAWILTVFFALGMVSAEVAQAAPCSQHRTTFATKAYKTVAGVDQDLLSLDIYGYNVPRAGCERVPVLIWVHGGAWQIGDKANLKYKDDFAKSRGYVFVSVNYRLSPEVQHPTHVQDVASAVKYVADNIRAFGGDPSKIALMGHSAGAHLVALLATSDRYLPAVGLSRGRVKCTAALDTEALNIPRALLTADSTQREYYTTAFGTDPEVHKEASPYYHVEAGAGISPFFLVRRGASDRKAIVNEFVSALTTAGIASTVVDTPGYSHAEVNNLIGAPGENIITPPLTRFLNSCFR